MCITELKSELSLKRHLLFGNVEKYILYSDNLICYKCIFVINTSVAFCNKIFTISFWLVIEGIHLSLINSSLSQ